MTVIATQIAASLCEQGGFSTPVMLHGLLLLVSHCCWFHLQSNVAYVEARPYSLLLADS